MKNVTLPTIFQPFICDDIIRLGKENDGGYLVNYIDVFKSKSLLGFGVGSDISFEKDFTEINDVKVETFDASTMTIENLPFYSKNRFHRYENINKDNIETFLTNVESVFLKCDIDGGEYEILNSLISNSHKFTGAVIEFHEVSSPQRFNELTNFISKFGLRLIHTHINNYSYIIDDNMYYVDVLELSFSSSKENTRVSNDITMPHRFDMPNNPNDDEFKIWF